MRTLQPLQTSLTLSLIVVIFVTFLSDRHIWVHNNNVELLNNNVELYVLTNPEVTFSTYLLQINTNTNLPATITMMNLDNDTASFNESFPTAQDLVSESEDDYYSNDESNNERNEDKNEDEDKLDNTVPEELSSPIRPFIMKHT